MKKLIIFIITVLTLTACDSPEHDLVITIINNSKDTLLFEAGFTENNKIDTSYFFSYNYFEHRTEYNKYCLILP